MCVRKIVRTSRLSQSIEAGMTGAGERFPCGLGGSAGAACCYLNDISMSRGYGENQGRGHVVLPEDD
jgi:hypothetical protein